MAAYFNLTLDTIAPSGVTLVLLNGAAYTANTSIAAQIGTTDSETTGYTMKIYGNVVGAESKESAEWQAYNPNPTINLTQGDGLKTVNLIIRDAVWNESTPVTKTITLDTSIPTVTIVGPDVSVISKIAGKDTSIFTFTSDVDFVQYKVGVVTSGTSTHGTATQIPTDAGSQNVSGNTPVAASTNVEVTIKGTDLSNAVSGADGTHIIKVFVKNAAGTWSK